LIKAVRREIKEELNIKPLKITDLKFKIVVEIPSGIDVRFLEHDEPHSWYSVENLPKILTYPKQIKPVNLIKGML